MRKKARGGSWQGRAGSEGSSWVDAGRPPLSRQERDPGGAGPGKSRNGGRKVGGTEGEGIRSRSHGRGIFSGPFAPPRSQARNPPTVLIVPRPGERIPRCGKCDAAGRGTGDRGIGGSGPLPILWQDRSQGGRGLSSGLSVPCRPRTFSEPGGLLSRQPSTVPPFVPAQDSSFGAPPLRGSAPVFSFSPRGEESVLVVRGRSRKGPEEAGRRGGYASLFSFFAHSLSSPSWPLPGSPVSSLGFQR